MENIFQQKKKCFYYISTGSNGSNKMWFHSALANRCLMQADTLMLILCDDWDAAAVINVSGVFLHPYGLHKANRLVSLSVGNILKLHVKKKL